MFILMCYIDNLPTIHGDRVHFHSNYIFISYFQKLCFVISVSLGTVSHHFARIALNANKHTLWKHFWSIRARGGTHRDVSPYHSMFLYTSSVITYGAKYYNMLRHYTLSRLMLEVRRSDTCTRPYSLPFTGRHFCKT
jgi:hypothetical protein